ncbi:uncharacterized protein LOC129115276 [Anoplopoma fimbria]|uniref:uncharacterized protein LOC129115276 n=1 Tax=Anoplopoma fimbria TaxID=229290 RepID=UPI0023ECB698|nr:uncharacterized protein LOC129115276 [Anoplopoma fimbria]
MFNRDQAALLSIQLLTMCQIFAEIDPVEHRNKLVSRGDSVTFTCNISKTNATQIRWTKEGFVFVFTISMNLTFSNFTSERLRIDKNLPSTMNIFKVQHDDAGPYRCYLNDLKGERAIQWNLTVSGEPKEFSPLWFFLYVLPAVIGFLLCCITPAVCLYRSWTENPNQDQESETLSYAQFRVQLGKEVAPPQPHSCAEYRTNHKQDKVGTSRGSIQSLAC